MVRLTLDLTGVTPLTRMQTEHLADLAGRFSSRILFEHRSRIINGKSMLGLLSLGDTGGEAVDLICDGPDEEAAARAIKENLLRGEAPPKSAADAWVLMQRVKDKFSAILDDNLAGIYLHGSLAAGCFRWEHSDIDFLTVVKKEPSLRVKTVLLSALREIEKDAPPKGVEMSVLLQEDCRNIQYPMPYVLHYSSGHRKDYDQDPRAFCERMHGTDPDLTAHILALHAWGRPVLGPDILRVFDQVKREDALRAIRYDAADAREQLNENPIYYVLNLCRAIAYLRQGLVLSKKDGGEWALKEAPQEYQPLIQAALNAYASGLDMTYDEKQAEDFCLDALDEIEGAAADENK